MKLEKAANLMGAGLSTLSPALLEKDARRFAIDSREVEAGSVFFALSQPDYKNNCFNGDFSDSHVHIPSAFEKGAIACVARPDRYREHEDILSPFKERLIFVEDVIAAFQKLAGGVYSEWGKPVVGVTGSAGKTTAKGLIADTLASKFRVLTNIKNYNNGLGLPLTVLRLLYEGDFDVAVLEMGMSTPNNEIARLCRIAPPDVAVELNVLPVHVEHLGSIENVAKAKAELVQGMKPGGSAVLNADDFRVRAMSSLCEKYTDYGIDTEADVMAKDIEFRKFGETIFKLITPEGAAHVSFPLSGKHNVSNALAAAAVGHLFGMSAQEIADSLEVVKAPSQRGELLRFEAGFTIINDSYNSNPDALLSMVKTLVEGSSAAERKIVVAGEMRELGPNSASIHFETGKAIAAAGIDKLIGIEGNAQDLVSGAREAGLKDVSFYPGSDSAAVEVAGLVEAGDLILVKGSRGVKTEKVIEKILEGYKLRQKPD